MKRLAITAVALAALSSAVPASAEQFGVGIGPNGVTVGSTRDNYRDRDRDYVRDRDSYRDRDETVIIKKRRDFDDPDRRVIIDRR